MLTTCMNDPGPIADGNGGTKIDPNYNRQYSQFCYTFQYMPGSTTYLDTPVVPIAAFAGPNQQPLNCQVPTGTPVIETVSGPTNVGPYVANRDDVVTLTAAVGSGFGAAQGNITVTEPNGRVRNAPVVSWSDTIVEVEVPRSGHMVVTTAAGTATETGIYVTVGGGATFVAPGGSIQTAIDAASPGDLIIVPPGYYEQLVIMHKPVRLQGSGSSTLISAIKAPAEKLAAWRTKVDNLLATNAVSLLPEQGNVLGLNGADALFTEEGPGIIVLAKDSGPALFKDHPSRIDGFAITGADHAGGILVNAYARGLQISDNHIYGNHGIYGGGIRVGHPLFDGGDANRDIHIHHNYVAENGGSQIAGGGIALYQGSRDYIVNDNFICGNFSAGNGGGIGHYGLSDGGLIANNTIIFNQTFTQGVAVSGGGIYIGGIPVLNGLTLGSGEVEIASNLIQGNQAGAGDGGGIRIAFADGANLTIENGKAKNENKIKIEDNIIVNNMAGYAGGGISLQDTIKTDIKNNTIAHNDSTATAGEAFAPGSPNTSTPQAAGIVSRANSFELAAFLAGTNEPAFSDPKLKENVIYRNRAFFFDVAPAGFGLVAATPQYRDLAVIGTPGQMDPEDSLLTDITGYNGNGNIDGSSFTPADLFVSAYVNTGNGQTIQQVELSTTIAAQPAFDEGGNFIDVRFGPLGLTGDYTYIGPNTGQVGGTLPPVDVFDD